MPNNIIITCVYIYVCNSCPDSFFHLFSVIPANVPAAGCWDEFCMFVFKSCTLLQRILRYGGPEAGNLLGLRQSSRSLSRVS